MCVRACEFVCIHMYMMYMNPVFFLRMIHCVCVYVCLYVYIYIKYIHPVFPRMIHIRGKKGVFSICENIYLHIQYMFVYILTYACVSCPVYVYVHVYICVYVHVYICVYVHVYICVYVYE